MATENELLEKIRSAGIALCYNQNTIAFGTAYVQGLKGTLKIVDDSVCSTAAVSPDGFIIGRGFLSAGDTGLVVFTMYHETGHVVLKHFQLAVDLALAQVYEDERGARHLRVVPGKEHENKLLNVAGDAIINEFASAAGLRCPDWCIRRDNLSKFTGGKAYPADAKWNTEAVYRWLVANQPQQQPQQGGRPGQQNKNPGQQSGQGGQQPQQGQQPGQQQQQQQQQGQPGPASQQPLPGSGCGVVGLPPALPKIMEEQMRATVREKSIGKGHAALADMLKPRPATVDWKTVLKNSFETASVDAEEQTERSFARMSRRQSIDPDIIKPGLIGTEAKIAVVVDVSGSVGPQWAAAAAGYVQKLGADFPGIKVFLASHTSELCWSGWVTPETDTEAIGKALAFSGGTDAEPAYTAVADQKVGFDVLVHFTDGYLPGWPKNPAKKQVVGVMCRTDTPEGLPPSARVVFVRP